MRVLVLSHTQFVSLCISNKFNDKNVEELKESAFISIVDTLGTDLVHWFKHDHKNVLNLDFDDIDTDTLTTEEYTATGFTFKQGKKVLRFLENIDRQKVKLLIVHCAAGISRSGAIGEFANDYFKLNRKTFIKNNPYIHPNGRVKRILNRLLREIKDDY